MAVIKNLGSGSSGNCYLIKFENSKTAYSQTIMLENGFSLKETAKRSVLNGNGLKQVKSCVVSHGHKDHCIGSSEFEKKLGIEIYASAETLESFKSKRVNTHSLVPNRERTIAPKIIVHPFEVQHDFKGTLGYIIWCTETNEKILFITDAKYVDFSKCDLSKYLYDYVMIECNYSDRQVRAIYEPSRKRIEDGIGTEEDRANVKEYERVINSHMSLYGTIKTLKRLDLRRCKGIFLLHLSKRHANPYELKTIVQSNFKIPTFVCRREGGVI